MTLIWHKGSDHNANDVENQGRFILLDTLTTVLIISSIQPYHMSPQK
ncbi:hypothetical protein URH17368_1602 [Alicyclobacillus hesperidum URH17-3-68]|nr:hypothetical protein URH17368_1602 [Alicyclobacillus hesperidum URH17-3-68]